MTNLAIISMQKLFDCQMFRQAAEIIHPVIDGSSDGCCGGSVKFSPCMKITAVMGEIWPGKWGLWLMVVQISFLKCDVLSQFEDRYSKVLLSLLMTSSFKVNKLYSLPSRFTEQKARLGGETECFFLNNEPTGNHQPLSATSQALLSGKLKKFTAQLYNLFLFSLPQLEWWRRKAVSSNEI